MNRTGTKARRHEGTKGDRRAGSHCVPACLRAGVPSAGWSFAFRRGFSFTEVMFAVIILGIGFIMVAAIFPVAIQQAKSSTEETSAASIALAASDFTSRLALSRFSFYPVSDTTNHVEGPLFVGSDLLLGYDAKKQLKPPQATATQAVSPLPSLSPGQSQTVRGKVVCFGDPRILELNVPGAPVDYPLRSAMWNAIRGDVIVSSDPRYAWIALYKRDRTYRNTNTSIPRSLDESDVTKDDSPLAQVFLFAVQARNTATFGPTDLTRFGNFVANLQPRPTMLSIGEQNGESFVTILNNALNVDALVEGAYVIVSDDMLRNLSLSSTPAEFDPNRGRFNGRIYRIGVRRPDLDQNNRLVWQLAPGGEFVPEPDPDANGPLIAVNALIDIEAFIIGRGYTNPADPRQGHSGPSMAISAYTTFVRVN